MSVPIRSPLRNLVRLTTIRSPRQILWRRVGLRMVSLSRLPGCGERSDHWQGKTPHYLTAYRGDPPTIPGRRVVSPGSEIPIEILHTYVIQAASGIARHLRLYRGG